MERSSCLFGCGAGDETVLVGRDRLHGMAGEFIVVRCRACGLIRTDPRPTRASIGLYYPEEYGPHLVPAGRESEPSPSSYPAWKALALRAHRFLSRDMYRFHNEALPDMPLGRMLEIGCASGSFLSRMRRKGWEVEGIESSDRAAQAAVAAGFSVRTGTLEEAPDPQRPYDLIVGWMVLEHLHDPLLGLTKLRRWLAPGGRLAVSVPNAGSLEFRFFRDAWYALQLPTHLYHFTPKTLTKLLAASGWRKEKILHQRVLSNLAGSLGHLLRDRGHRGRLVRALEELPTIGGRWHYRLYPIASMLGMFGQTGRMTVWARRDDG